MFDFWRVLTDKSLLFCGAHAPRSDFCHGESDDERYGTAVFTSMEVGASYADDGNRIKTLFLHAKQSSAYDAPTSLGVKR